MATLAPRSSAARRIAGITLSVTKPCPSLLPSLCAGPITISYKLIIFKLNRPIRTPPRDHDHVIYKVAEVTREDIRVRARIRAQGRVERGANIIRRHILDIVHVLFLHTRVPSAAESCGPSATSQLGRSRGCRTTGSRRRARAGSTASWAKPSERNRFTLNCEKKEEHGSEAHQQCAHSSCDRPLPPLSRSVWSYLACSQRGKHQPCYCCSPW